MLLQQKKGRTVGAIRPGVGSGGVSCLFNAITVGLRCGYVKGHSSSNAAAERSAGKAWRELTAVESVDPSQSLALVDQCCEFVGCVLDQIEHGFRVFQDLSHDNENVSDFLYFLDMLHGDGQSWPVSFIRQDVIKHFKKTEEKKLR